MDDNVEKMSLDDLKRIPVIGFLVRKITTPRPWARFLMDKYPSRAGVFASISFGLEIFYLSLIIILLGKVNVYCPTFVNNTPLDVPPGLVLN